ncbi:MAG: hypothetical protein JWN61_3378 [Pseudonocardiales bacterium]|nr:hypothetical protein [Jatrophihabitantaceae bacterium]MCW2605243.1 hypothetical protein [Pseudonocardiales bacterium]
MTRRPEPAARPVAALIAGLVAVMLVLTACAAPIAGSGRLATPTGGPKPPEVEASRTCPSIVDPVAHLAYTCIDDSLEHTFSPTYDPTFAPDGIVMTLTTEPGWVASQQSGRLLVDGASAKDVALSAGKEQAASNYGDDPRPATVLSQAVPGLGQEAYRLDQLITLDPTYVKQRQLIAKSEMLTTVVVRLEDSSFVALSISIPDTQKQWWPRFETVIASLKVL